MKMMLLSILAMMLLFAGCADENKTMGANEQNNEQIIENASDNYKTPAEHIIDTEMIDSLKNSEDNVVLIKDKLFIAQCNDIYFNTEDYMDKTIKWEGIYTELTSPDTNETYKFVIRYGPGCCGYDGTAGFEILYDGDMPKKDDWVEAVGKVEMIEEDGQEFLAVRLSKLTVLDVRGEEYVIN